MSSQLKLSERDTSEAAADSSLGVAESSGAYNESLRQAGKFIHEAESMSS